MRRQGWLFVGAVIVWGGVMSPCSGVCPLPAAGTAVAAHALEAPAQRTFDDDVRDLRNTDPKVRIEAARALAATGRPQAIVPLSGLLTDPEDDIQIEVLRQLLGFYLVEPPKTSSRVALVFEVRKTTDAEGAFDAGPFVVLPRPSPPELIAGLAGAMRDLSPYIRLQATYAMGVMARRPLDPVGVEVLTAALRDPVKDVRVAAARVLGALRVTTAGEALVSAVNDQEAAVRMAAMRALGDIREVRAVQALTAQLRYYKRGEVAVAAFDGLARIAHPSSVPVFQEYLGDRYAPGRRYAAEGLARAGDKNAAASVDPLFQKEKDPPAWLAMAYALHAGGRPTLASIVETLGTDALAPQAMGYLVEMGRPVVKTLAGSLQSGPPAVRERVAMVLGVIGGPEALAALEGRPQDDNVAVARAVERAIARLRLPAK